MNPSPSQLQICPGILKSASDLGLTIIRSLRQFKLPNSEFRLLEIEEGDDLGSLAITASLAITVVLNKWLIRMTILENDMREACGGSDFAVEENPLSSVCNRVQRASEIHSKLRMPRRGMVATALTSCPIYTSKLDDQSSLITTEGESAAVETKIRVEIPNSALAGAEYDALVPPASLGEQRAELVERGCGRRGINGRDS
ncbi:hypothetical protein DM860_009526 [Cuscuta australis]|uniref:Uncharacterized protein n=1 Tax=Cuscuta australis TaxID=267555 RepID=A0A328DIP7_9ASTE|nr:hypothetical protein DM860_009526 [Cuscuta australis]